MKLQEQFLCVELKGLKNVKLFAFSSNHVPCTRQFLSLTIVLDVY